MSWDEIAEALEAVRSLCEPPAQLTVETHENALRLATLLQYNIYDALILAAANDAGCSTLYSEDMQDGQNRIAHYPQSIFRPRREVKCVGQQGNLLHDLLAEQTVKVEADQGNSVSPPHS